MKNTLKVLPIVFALMLLFAQPAFAAETQQANIIQTSATSTIKVDPDLVQIDLMIQTEENSAALAQENNASAVSQAMNLLLNEGLTNDEIKTTNYSTYSYTKTDSNDNETTVYSTTSTLEATFKQLNLVSEILNKLAAINEVNISSVNYSVQDPSQYKQQVIAAAIASAKQNITYSAEALNVTLDKLVNLNINFNSDSESLPFSRNTATSKGAGDSQPQNPDKIAISATADMSYSIQQ